MRRLRPLAVCLAIVSGCGDDGGSPTDGGMDGTIMLDSGRDGARPDGARPDGGGGDGNDSFDQAVEITLNDPDGAMGDINPAGDFDYYRFTLMMDSWIRIATEGNPDDDPEMIDTVITLFEDDTTTQLAENDDSVPRVSTDSEIIGFFPAGTYYIELQEFSTWDPDAPMPEGMASFDYTVTVAELNLDAAIVADDPEMGDDASTATMVGLDMGFGLVVGTFNDNSDVDVFRTTGTMREFHTASFMPSGVDGYGSTTAPGRIRFTSADGMTVIAQIDVGMGVTEIEPPVEAGMDYLIWIEHPGTPAGQNDFYVAKQFRLMDNPPETMDATNGDRAGAEAIPLTDDMMTGTRGGFILATLGDMDEDFFSFDVTAADLMTAGDHVSIACGSRSSGSGVMGLVAEVQDSTGAVVSMATETLTDGAFIENAMITTAGTYYLRLRKSGQDPVVTGNWVRCGIRSGVPMEMP